MSYKVNLPLFQGPFDLLLFFIERDELDIYDIPIAKITDDFLAYIRELEKLNIEVASEFIWVAATLMRIKARMLIPRPDLDEQGNEIDPREELVQQLLEYKKYKSVIQDFAALEAERQAKFERGNVEKELQSMAEEIGTELELQSLDLYKLMKVFEKVLLKFENRESVPVHTVISYPFTIEGQKTRLLERLLSEEKLAFEEWLLSMQTRIEAVYNFLAILELIATGHIAITAGEGFNKFWLGLKQEGEAALSEIIPD